MDAGLAAVLGALIGALTVPLSAYFTRRADRADRKQQMTFELRERQREAILDVQGVMVELMRNSDPGDRPAAERAMAAAMTRLDLLIGAGDNEIMSSLRQVVPQLLTGTDPDTLEGVRAIRAAAAWTQGTARWLRGETSAHTVLIAVAGG